MIKVRHTHTYIYRKLSVFRTS